MNKAQPYKIIVKTVHNSLFAPYIVADGIPIEALTKFDNTIANGISQVFGIIFGKRPRRFLNGRLKGYLGTFIVMDFSMSKNDLIWLKDNNPEARIVFVYWNPIERATVSIEDVREIGLEIWSYGEEQCKRNKVKRIHAYVCKSMYKKAWGSAETGAYDIIFAGKDKGRKEYLKQMISERGWSNLRWELYFTADHFWQRYKSKEYKKSIPYDELQVLHSKSKAILELTPTDTVDITMRTMDSLLLKRKLITNAKSIKERVYYHPNNIFVIDDDADETLEEFLEKEYVPVEEEILEQFYIERWVKRILEDDPVQDFSEN